MHHDDLNVFCKSLKHSTYVMQWGNSHVWKIGGKVFVIGGWHEDYPTCSFKVTPLAYEILKNQPGLRPAPYLASRGMTWIQNYSVQGLSDEALKDYIMQSYRIVAAGLTKIKQRELGLL